MGRKKAKRGWLSHLLELEAEEPPTGGKPETTVTLQPALRQLGITDCPICRREVAVFLTKTNRPFVNCGFCSARIFYNGREAMRRLKKKMQTIEE